MSPTPVDRHHQRERAAAFLHSARVQLESSDELLSLDHYARRVTKIGRAVDDALDALAMIDRRLAALEEEQA